MRVRKPIHFALYGQSYKRIGNEWFRITICGIASYSTYGSSSRYTNAQRRVMTSSRRVTIELMAVTCADCLAEIIRVCNVARGARLRMTAPLRKVQARQVRNGLEDLVSTA